MHTEPDTGDNVMSETPAAEVAPTAVETPVVPSEPSGTDLAAEVEKWKALSRKHEDQSKANADKAKQFDALEEASKSEQQKLIDATAKAQKEAADTAAELARMKAAVKHGLSEDDLDLLGTGTPEEIEQRAEKLAARLKVAIPAVPPATGQGKVGDPVNTKREQLTREQLKGMTPDQITEAKAAGRLDDLLGIKP